MATVMPDRPQVAVRSYADGDERLILAGFNRVFGQARSLEHWTWKFKENPYRKAVMAALAFDSKGSVVGHYSLIPLKLNISGRAVLAAQSVDTFVSDECRGQGVFLRCASHCYDECIEEGVEAVYGFPNENSSPGFIRALGWSRIAHLTRYRCRLSVKRPLARILRLPVLPGLLEGFYRAALRAKISVRGIFSGRQSRVATKFHISSSLPRDYNDLWQSCKDREPISLWKDEEYLTWRYCRNPDREFRFCTLRAGDELLALGVLWITPHETYITELFAKGKDIGFAKRLVLEVVKLSLSTGKEQVLFIGQDAGFFQQVFSDFMARPLSDIALCGRTLQENAGFGAEFTIPENWTITYGDTDAL
jgi:hypothetical protein